MQRPSSCFLRSDRATGRQQRDQSGDAPALPNAVPVLEVVHTKVTQRPGCLLLLSGRAAGREQRDQRREAPALPDAVPMLVVVHAQVAQRPGRLLVLSGRAARRKEPDERRDTPALLRAVASVSLPSLKVTSVRAARSCAAAHADAVPGVGDSHTGAPAVTRRRAAWPPLL